MSTDIMVARQMDAHDLLLEMTNNLLICAQSADDHEAAAKISAVLKVGHASPLEVLRGPFRVMFKEIVSPAIVRAVVACPAESAFHLSIPDIEVFEGQAGECAAHTRPPSFRAGGGKLRR